MIKISLLTLIVLLFIFTSCSSEPKFPASSVHNPDLGVIIKIGDNIAEVTKKIGNGTKTDYNDDIYDYDGLSIVYGNFKVASIFIESNKWFTFDGITVGSKKAQYSKNYSKDKDTYFDDESKKTDYKEFAISSIGIVTSDDNKVTMVIVSDVL